MTSSLSRRSFLRGSAMLAGAAASAGLPTLAFAQKVPGCVARRRQWRRDQAAGRGNRRQRILDRPLRCRAEGHGRHRPAGQPLPVQELAPKVYETLVAHWNLPGRESVIAYHGSTRR
jgi:hypothetical protein